MGNKARIWMGNDQERQMVAPDGGAVVPLFNHFTTQKNNKIFFVHVDVHAALGPPKICYSNRLIQMMARSGYGSP